MKIVKSLQELGILIKVLGGFIGTLLGTLGASLLERSDGNESRTRYN